MSAQRGQAVVEFALGMLVMISVLTMGIHLAEIGYLEMKTTEAAHAVIFDTTARKMHEWPGNVMPATAAVTQSRADVQARYADFDGRQSAMGTPTLTKMFTTASNLTVQCDRTRPPPTFRPAMQTSGAYSDNSGISCTASVQLNSINIPQNFYNDSLFTETNDQSVTMVACALGRNYGGGGCRGRFVSMLDDWGLSGPPESMMCPLIQDLPLLPCMNRPYYRMAFGTFMRNGAGAGIAGSTLAQRTVMRMPFPFFFGGENVFWMSAMTEQTNFVQPIVTVGSPLWTTTPGGFVGTSLPVGGMYSISYLALRRGCFLGKRGC